VNASGALQARPNSRRESRVVSHSWKIVLIEQASLRKEAVSECNAAMAQLTEVRNHWHHFERKDKPAFIRWRAREFGALLSEARQVDEKIRKARDLIHEVELELRRFFQTPQSAYARVMFRRENPGMDEPTPEANEGGGRRPLTSFEQETLFQEWVRKFLGTNPDKMDDRAYESSFAAFKTHMFSQTSRPSPRPEAPRQGELPHLESSEQEAEADATIDERVKILYRRLARELHPDTRADGSVEVSSLWHEVQEAYAASDVARMELLLALSALQTENLENESSMGDLQLVLHNLCRSLRALTKSVEEAEKEDAWDFARLGPTPELAREVERQLKFDLGNRARYLDQLQGRIAEWQGHVEL
jgi:hypothetical protein